MRNILLILTIFWCLSSNAQDCSFQKIETAIAYNFCNSDPWVLIFSDDFNDTILDLTKWQPITGVNRDLNFALEKQWHKPENLILRNGTLKIVSKIENQSNMPVVTNWNPYTVKYENFTYTSGEIWSQNQFSFGKYEARIKVPTGTGLWPAFWLFGGSLSDEIDIFEFFGDKPNKISMNSHHNGMQCPIDANFNNDFNFHIFTLIYEKYKIEWYIDGVLQRRILRYYNILGQEVGCTINPFTVYVMNKSFPLDPMSIVLNTSIQSGNKAPNGSIYFPVLMEIDWIRHYIHNNACQSILVSSPDQIVYNSYYNVLTGTDITIKPTSNVNVNIVAGKQYKMIAQNSIVMKPGFNVKSGADYNAKIDPLLCTNTYRTASESRNETVEYTTEEEHISYQDKIYVYPNPSSNRNFTLKVTEDLLNADYQICDMNGKNILKGSTTQLENSIDLTGHASGIYYITLQNNGKTMREKLIIL